MTGSQRARNKLLINSGGLAIVQSKGKAVILPSKLASSSNKTPTQGKVNCYLNSYVTSSLDSRRAVPELEQFEGARRWPISSRQRRAAAALIAQESER